VAGFGILPLRALSGLTSLSVGVHELSKNCSHTFIDRIGLAQAIIVVKHSPIPQGLFCDVQRKCGHPQSTSQCEEAYNCYTSNAKSSLRDRRRGRSTKADVALAYTCPAFG